MLPPSNPFLSRLFIHNTVKTGHEYATTEAEPPRFRRPDDGVDGQA
jgi:hypothetical protein